MIRITTLGRVSVRKDDFEIEELARRRLLLALFVYLVVEKRVTREQLAAVFWSGKAPAHARHSLNQAIYQLRSIVGEGCVRSAGEEYEVTSLVDVDLAEFRRRVKAGDRERALGLYEGPFLDGFILDMPAFEHWASAQRASAGRAARILFREIVDECVTQANLVRAVSLARQWTQIDPQDDESQHRLIELLAAAGQRTEALRQFELYELALAADDLRPLDETMELAAAIRRGDLPTFAANPHVSHNERNASDIQPESQTHADGTMRFGGQTQLGPRLIRILEGGQPAETYLLTKARTRIGRSHCELTFPADEAMSQIHASIAIRSSQRAGENTTRYYLRDEDSATGVYLRLRNPWPLQPGDEWLAGRVHFRLESTAQDPPVS